MAKLIVVAGYSDAGESVNYYFTDHFIMHLKEQRKGGKRLSVLFVF